MISYPLPDRVIERGLAAARDDEVPFEVLAILRHEPTDLGGLPGEGFVQTYDDLGPVRVAVFGLADGRRFALMRHQEASTPGTELAAPQSSLDRRSLVRFLRALRLKVADTTWIHPSARAREDKGSIRRKEALQDIGLVGTTATYVAGEYRPEPGWPRPRFPGVMVRVVPNEVLLPGELGRELGDLMQRFVDLGAAEGVEIRLDTSDRTRPGEQRSGASGVEALALLVAGGLTTLGIRQLNRLADRFFDAAVDWVIQRVQRRPPTHDPVVVLLHGPRGEVIKRVVVPPQATRESVVRDSGHR